MLSLTGGDVEIVGTNINAESSTVNLAAVTGPGQVRVTDSTVEAVGQSTIRLDGAALNTSGNGGGTVRIRGGTLVADQSTVLANNTGERAAAGGIDVQVIGTADFNASSLTTDALGAGRGGSLNVTAGDLSIRNGAFLTSDTYGPGQAGMVQVQADHLLVSNDGGSFLTGIFSRALHGSTGAAGTIQIIADTLELQDGGQIVTGTFAQGNAGQITVDADRLVITGGPGEFATLISSSAEQDSTGGRRAQ
jgi:large exoprotein involved in heme utilization and adhesion